MYDLDPGKLILCSVVQCKQGGVENEDDKSDERALHAGVKARSCAVGGGRRPEHCCGTQTLGFVQQTPIKLAQGQAVKARSLG